VSKRSPPHHRRSRTARCVPRWFSRHTGSVSNRPLEWEIVPISKTRSERRPLGSFRIHARTRRAAPRTQALARVWPLDEAPGARERAFFALDATRPENTEGAPLREVTRLRLA